MSPSKCLLAIAHDGEASFMKVYDDYAAKDHSDTLLYKPCFCDRLAKNDGDSVSECVWFQVGCSKYSRSGVVQ